MSEKEAKKEGLKFDSGKNKISLIPTEVINGMADVLTFGASKYGKLNWLNGIDYSRLIDAANRHLLAFQSGEDLDKESNKSHLLHCMVNLAFLYYFTNHKPELDDRWEKHD